MLVNRRCGSLPAVLIDNLEGVRLALEHLRALGHRTIAYVGGPATSWSNRARLTAARAIVAEHPTPSLVDLGSFQPYVSGGIAAGDLLIASGASAALAYNDLVAFGLLDRLKQRGVQVPDEISVVGVDNIPMSALSLTGADQRRHPAGQLRARRSGRARVPAAAPRPAAHPPPRPVVPLVVRDSTAPRRSSESLRDTA